VRGYGFDTDMKDKDDDSRGSGPTHCQRRRAHRLARQTIGLARPRRAGGRQQISR
jgi:hypothetical protein